MATEITHRPTSPLERLTEAAISYAEAEEDEDFERAKDNLRKSASAYGRRHVAEAIRAALADARARGVRLGAPPKVDPLLAEEIIRAVGSVKRAAVELGVSVRTLQRARRRTSTEPDTNQDSVAR